MDYGITAIRSWLVVRATNLAIAACPLPAGLTQKLGLCSLSASVVAAACLRHVAPAPAALPCVAPLRPSGHPALPRRPPPFRPLFRPPPSPSSRPPPLLCTPPPLFSPSRLCRPLFVLDRVLDARHHALRKCPRHHLPPQLHLSILSRWWRVSGQGGGGRGQCCGWRVGACYGGGGG